MSLMPFSDPFFNSHRWMAPYRTPYLSPFSDNLLHSVMNDTLGQFQQLERQLGELEPSIDSKTGDFTFRCNVQGYRPEELQVDMQGDQLVIQGSHTHKDGRQSVERTFKRIVTVPENVQKETIQCNIDERGRLEVRALSKAIEQGQQRKNIPIGFRQSKDQPQAIAGDEQQKPLLEGQKK